MKKYTVLKTAFHGGGIIKETDSITEAIKAMNKYRNKTCTCGCAGIIPKNWEAEKEMHKHFMASRYIIDDIKPYTGNESPYTLTK